MIKKAETPEEAVVFVVDDDPAVHKSVSAIASQMGLRFQSFSSGLSFLDTVNEHSAGCVIAEVRIADIGGLQLQRRLASTGSTMPFIFLSSHGSIRLAVRAVKEGAVEFIEKPFQEQPMWDAIQQAVNLNRHRRQAKAENDRMKELFLSLSDRERNVLWMVMNGKVNREIADEEAISVRTVELQRSRLMHKFGARNIQDLIRIALVLDCRLSGRCHLECRQGDEQYLNMPSMIC
jgi:FixJ family two-component response regulator